MKKSMLRLVSTANGEEYFELNKNEAGTVPTSKNHQGGLEVTEDHSDGKIFSTPGSLRCPVALSKVYLAHLNPENDALFQSQKSHPTSLVLIFAQCGLALESSDTTPSRICGKS